VLLDYSARESLGRTVGQEARVVAPLACALGLSTDPSTSFGYFF